jgi:hypothetical protein
MKWLRHFLFWIHEFHEFSELLSPNFDWVLLYNLFGSGLSRLG